MSDLEALLEKLEFKGNDPLGAGERARMLEEYELELPAELEEFYNLADGGVLPVLECSFFSLGQALERTDMFEHLESFSAFPIFQSDNARSDPCVMMIGGPFPGAIYQHHHALARRVLAPDLHALLQQLTSLPPEWLELEAQSFMYPGKLKQKEQKAVTNLLETSKKDLQDDYEPQLLVALALSMLRDEDVPEWFSGWEHPNFNARHEISMRLARIQP